jgi:peptide/nickel transport system permease protein
MFQYIVKRLLITIPLIIGVCTISFFLIHLIPGDPVDIMLGEQASLEEKNSLRKELGLDRPILAQYGAFLNGLAKFDLGRSLQSGRPVTEEIAKRFPATVELTLAAMLIAIIFAIPLGIIAAVKQHSIFDQAIMSIGLLGMSVPGFWLGPMLILIFSIQLDLLPVSERGGIEHLILPALSLALALGSILLRMTRASMLEVIKEDYIRTAKSKGLSSRAIYFKHALRNALMPIITIIGLQFGALLTGTVITETIFDWPGVGTLLYSGIQQRNYPQVQACIIFISVIYVLVNLFVDIAYAWANPKVRYE